MYELINGAHRLVDAMDSRKEDKHFIQELAEVLYYVPEQLEQDIQALNDFISQAKIENKD